MEILAGVLLFRLAVWHVAKRVRARRRRQAEAAYAAAMDAYNVEMEAYFDHADEVLGRQGELLEIIDALPRDRAVLTDLLTAVDEHPAGVDPATVPEAVDVPAGAKFLSAGSATLCAPRVAYRGGPTVQTDLEDGTLTVTDRALTFVGPTRTERWPLEKLVGVSREGNRILLPLRSRRTVTGLSAADEVGADLIEAQATWARGLPSPPVHARSLLARALVKFDARAEEVRAESTALGREVDDLDAQRPTEPEPPAEE